ncbi:hypothetical protein FGO68_gene12359 [Halteria grandinella]|uniref:Uncharacterized protein n=1 Tax=Halteria grandinella TaxID=5974 RepID=A0A8J8NVD2_HALGN|nr:hypothetical protein FGO68_gene12359 [Halteria grandinella]
MNRDSKSNLGCELDGEVLKIYQILTLWESQCTSEIPSSTEHKSSNWAFSQKMSILNNQISLNSIKMNKLSAIYSRPACDSQEQTDFHHK